MLYQRYFLRMNQSNMTHVLGLLAGLAFALGMLLMLRLVVEDSQQFLATLERPENLSLAVTLVVCVAIYAGKYQKIKRQGTKFTKSLPPNHWTNLWRERFPSRVKTSPETKSKFHMDRTKIDSAGANESVKSPQPSPQDSNFLRDERSNLNFIRRVNEIVFHVFRRFRFSFG